MNEIIHGGAAGGIAATLRAFLNAELVNGGEHFFYKSPVLKKV